MSENFRVTTYQVGTGEFTGTTFSLTLEQELSENYFCMITPSGLTTELSDALIRVSGDPFGTGELNFSSGPDQLEFVRFTDAYDDWTGIITVVECIDNASTGGFILKDVLVSTMPDVTTASTLQSLNFASSAILSDRTIPFGGIRGGGVTSNINAGNSNKEYFAKFEVDVSTNELNIARYCRLPGTVDEVTFTTYLVEWGSEWSIKKASISGRSSGNFNAAIDDNYAWVSLDTPVPAFNSWAWGSGYSEITSNVQRDIDTAQVYSLGRAGNYSIQTDKVGVLSGTNTLMVSTVYIMTHPDIYVERFILGRITATSGTFNMSLGPDEPEVQNTVGNIKITSGKRFNLYSSSFNLTTANAIDHLNFDKLEITDDKTISWSRSGSGISSFVVYNVDFGGGDKTGNEISTSTLLSQVEYMPPTRIHTSTVLVQVDYKPPPEQNATASVAIQTELEYISRQRTDSVAIQVEWDNPDATGDGESRLVSLRLQSSTTPKDRGVLNSVVIQNSLTPNVIGNLYKLANQNAVISKDFGRIDSLISQSAATSKPIGRLSALCLQIAVTVPKGKEADEDIQGEYFKKRWKKFYKR